MNPHSNRMQHKPGFPAQSLRDRKVRTAALPALPELSIPDANAVLAGCCTNLGEGDVCRDGSSSCGDCEGQAEEMACPSLFRCGECSDVLLELSNVMTGVLTNAQVLSWKLPPYSHLKRWVRELERGAQRSGELLKRLRERCPDVP